MNYRALGKRGLMVSEIGFGAWAIGGAMWGGARDEQAGAALEAAWRAGINFFDTALVYGKGHSERLVGALVREHPDTPLYVATKVPPKNMQWPARPGTRLRDAFPAAHIRSSCEQSLRHLDLERIDLLQLHVFADAWAEQDEWYEEMVKLRTEGKIRLIGVSVNDHDPASALRVVRSGRLDAVQVIYNLFDQSPEDELLPACLEHKVGVIVRVPFDEGSLTGKLTVDTEFPPGDHRREYFAGRLDETVKRVEELRHILEGGVAKTLARGALRFCLDHPAVTTVIPGMRDPRQVDENVGAAQDPPIPPSVHTQLRHYRWVPK